VIDQLFEPLASTAELHSAAQGGMAALALSTMLNVWRNAEQLDRRGMLAAETSLHAVLVAAMNKGTPHAERADRAARDAAMRAAVERHIEAGLQGRDLSATSTARAFSISVRKLHGLFEQADRSYAQTVKHMRVRACAEDLMSGTAGAMTDIALRWGFSDLSHLNRTFRREYGCLPSALRRAAPRSSPSGSVIERQRG
jgi:AraC-like DNA-binding protein